MLILGNLLWRTTGAGAPPPAPPAPSAVIPSGGIPSPAPRSREDRARDRERFGISDPVLQAIRDVAARQAERLEQDSQKQYDELAGELALRKEEMEGRYLEALAIEREALIRAEIAMLMKKFLLSEDEAIIVLTLMAAAATV